MGLEHVFQSGPRGWQPVVRIQDMDQMYVHRRALHPVLLTERRSCPPPRELSVHLVGQQADAILGAEDSTLAVVEGQQPDWAVLGEPNGDSKVDRIHSPH